MAKLKKQEETSLKYIPHSRPTLGEEEVKAVSAVIASGNIAEGEVVARFEKTFAKKMGVRHAVAVSSGTAALHLTLLAMDIGPDDEVIIPSYVCTALLQAVQYVRARPIIAEIDPLTYNIDPEDVQKRITARTRAIIVPHMFGLAANLDQLLNFNVPIIEDCAQSVGAIYHKKPLGTFGDAAIFSFYATKMLATGEGGMVLSNSTEIIERIRDLKTYDEKEADTVRYNYKMTDVQAALGEVQLARLEDFIQQRRKIAGQYVKSLNSLNIKLPEENPEHIHYRFVVGLESDCNVLIQKLARKGIECARPVFLPIHRHLKLDGYAVTDKVWQTTLSIPIYPSLTNSDIEQLMADFIEVYDKHARSAAG
jgi:dTDP-4-amino-4,6-dideoxygalactose transaminase